MNAITDETLMSYADGVLSPTEMRRVASALETTPGLSARLEAFRWTQDGLRQPFAPILALPIPQRLLGAVVGKSLAGVQGKRGLRQRLFDPHAIGARSQRPAWSFSGGYRVPAWTLAASAVLVAGLSVGWLVYARQYDAWSGVPFHVWGVPAPEFMQDALEQNARGETAMRAGEPSLSLTPVASFRTRDGEWCRSYEKTAVQPTTNVVGLACRTASGSWRIKTETPALERFQPVGEKAQSAEATDPLEAIARQHMVGSELGRDEEAQQIQLRWRAPSR